MNLKPFCTMILSTASNIEVPSRLRKIVLDLFAESGGEIGKSGLAPLKSERDVFADDKRFGTLIG